MTERLTGSKKEIPGKTNVREFAGRFAKPVVYALIGGALGLFASGAIPGVLDLAGLGYLFGYVAWDKA